MFKKKRSFKKTIFTVVCILLLLTGYLFLDARLRPLITSKAKMEVTQMAVTTINQVVQKEVTSDDIDYQDFITVQRDYNGRVALMQANTVSINQMAANIALEVQKELQNLERKYVTISIGHLLDSYMLINIGPRIKVRIEPLGTVDVNVIDRFEQAGINQTRHKIYLDFTTTVRIGLPLPLHSNFVQIATTVPVAESIIVGDVPDAVINMSGGVLGLKANEK